MRIIGGHDYYDIALSSGRDESLTFVRKGVKANQLWPADNWTAALPRELQELAMEIRYVRNSHRQTIHFANKCELDDGEVSIDPITVWFVGKRYGGVRWTEQKHWWSKNSVKEKIEVFWSMKALEAALADVGAAIRTPKSRSALIWSDPRCRLQAHFDGVGTQLARDYLANNKIAIAVRDLSREKFGWFLDCDVLKSVEFQKVMDPWTAMQELSMHIGGLAHPEPRMVEIIDPKIKLAKHGFDQFSFRKSPSKKKSR